MKKTIIIEVCIWIFIALSGAALIWLYVSEFKNATPVFQSDEYRNKTTTPLYLK